MADELIDIYDEKDNFTGIRKMKSEAHLEGLWHRSVHIILYNSKGEMIIQQRAHDKDFYPDVWDISVAGHVSAGEDPEVSAVREVKEEIGVDINEKELHFAIAANIKDKYDKIVNNEIFYVYFLKFEGKISELKLQKEEVQDAKFISAEDLEKELKVNPGRFMFKGEIWKLIISRLKKLKSKK